MWSSFRAELGTEDEVEACPAECRAGIAHETGTTAFVAPKIGPGHDATFDTFRDDAAFEAHRHGPTAAALEARAPDPFEGDPDTVQAAIPDAKASGRVR